MSGKKISTFDQIHKSFSPDYNNNYDEEEYANLLKTLQYVFYILGFIYFLLAVSIGSIVLIKPITYLSNINEGWRIWALIIFTNTIYVTFNIYQIFLESINKISVVQKTLSKTNIIGIISLVLLSFISKAFIFVIIVQQSILLMNIILLRRKAIEEGGDLFSLLYIGKFQYNIIREVWKQAWKNGYTVIVASTVKYSAGIIIANMFPVAISAVFLFTKRIFEIIDSLLVSTTNVLLPKIAKLRISEDISVVLEYIQKILHLIFILYLISFVSFICFGESILGIVSPNVQLSSKLLIILFSFSHFFGRWGAVMGSIGHQSNIVYDHIAVTIYSTIYFTFSLLLLEYLGDNVFPIATMFGILVASAVTIKYIYRSLNTTFFQFEKDKLLPYSFLLVIINLIYYNY